MAAPSRHLALPVRLLLALALVVSLLPAMGSAAQAAVSAPTGLSASPAGSSTPTLSWKRVPSATKYDVEVSATSAFTTLLFSRPTTNRMIVPTVVLPEGTVYWRVRAVEATTTSAWSSATLSVTAPKAPRPQAPPNTVSSVLQQPTSPPLLSWEGVAAATAYQIEVDAVADGASEADFIDASSYTTKSTSFVVPDPKADGTYFWRVRAQLSNSLYTAYSTPWKYKIGPLQKVLNVTPANNENGALRDVVLEWDAVPGAKSYDLQVSTDDQFNTIVDSRVGIKSTRYSPPTTYVNDQYYWRIRARNNLDQTFDWSAPEVARYNFQRNWPTAPQLLKPANVLTPIAGDDVFFQWTPVDHATTYQLDVGNDPNFSTQNVTYKTCYTASTTYTAGYMAITNGFVTADACMPSQGAVTYWRVRALDEPKNVQGLFSPIQSFVYSSGIVQRLSPANGSTVAVPTLSWQAATDAVKYRVSLTNNAGTTNNFETYSLSWTPTSSSFFDPTKGPFRWSVVSIDADGRVSPRPPDWTFTLAGTPATTGVSPLTPLTPQSSATSRFPTLLWEPHPEAKHYVVSMGIAGSGFFFARDYAPVVKDNHLYPTATDTGEKLLNPGTYEWVVQAFAANGSLLGTGASSRFTITDLEPVRGQRIALSGTALDSGAVCTAALESPSPQPTKCDQVPTTPVLDWQPVPDAGLYKIYVGNDRELTGLVYDKIPATGNSRWTPRAQDFAMTPSALPDSQAGQAYYWYIRPCKTVNVCSADPVSKQDAATNAFNKTSPQVGNLQVRLTSGRVQNQAVFTWDDYLATNKLAKYPAAPLPVESSWQAAKQYRIQVSTSPSFATLVDTQLVDQTTYTAFDRTYPEGTYYWRVQAVDAANNGLTWAPTQSFVKQSPAPVLETPIGGASTSGLTAFEWAPTNFAGSYTLEVYRNDDTNWSPANRVVSVTGKQVAYAHSTPLPASSSAYVWRVARLDADNRPGQWSATGRFFSKGAAPSLTSPTPGATMSGYSPYFDWSEVTGAVTYRFERRAKGSSTLTENVVTAATSWASPAAILNGTWEWRVTALDVTGSTLGESPWQSFVVDNDKGMFTAISPTRVLDTRSGLGTWTARKIPAGQSIDVTMPNLAPGTTAVTLNVTAVNPSATSYLTVWPTGQTRPTASNVNFATGATVPNQVIAKVGTNNRVSIYNANGTVDVLADLAGYYAPDLGAAYTPVAPKRVLDTRSALGTSSTSKVGPGREVVLDITDLPAGAEAVTLNVTATSPTAASYVTVWPANASRPNASSLNFTAGQTVPNLVTVGVSPDGKVRLWNASGSTHLLADLAGWFAGDTAGQYTGVTPKRVLDTRSGLGGVPKAKLAAAPKTITLTVPGIPAGATAVALNVTATGPTKTSWLTVYPGNVGKPDASNLNYVAGQTVANMVVAKVAPGNQVTFSNAFGSVDVIADLAGYYTP
ncbi:fibronectin type III domain-containing protein [Rothia sp. ARF10]|nr:fibronectin type III domain-containing protein [Rothia sp. ARF10]